MHQLVDQRPTLLARVQAMLADRILLAVLALALALRLAAIVAFPSLHHPDENFQLFEQAHRIAFGYGVVPWEFREGIRSPVEPYGLAGLFWLGEKVAGGFLFIEGPMWKAGKLWFSDVRGDKVRNYDPATGKVAVILNDSGGVKNAE